MEKVRETFERLDEVAVVQIDFEAKTATLTTRPGRILTRATAEKALAATAYGLVSFEEATGGPAPEGH